MSSQVLKFLQQENQRLVDENRLLRDEVMAMRDYLAGLRTLQRAAEAITVEDEPVALLDKILYAALTVIDAADGSILLLDEEANELVFVVVHGELGTTLPGHRIPADAGIAGWVAMNREPQIVNNVRTDQRFYGGIDETFQFETVGLLCVPMVARGKLLGVIEVLNKFNRQEFSEADVDLMGLLAFIAATAIERLQSEPADRAVENAD
jgi:GAF domain-containing protein